MSKRPAFFPIVFALGVTILARAAHAQPAPINNCQTIGVPAAYELTNNLFANGGDCLVIIDHFITINLAGFTIYGAGRNGIVAMPLQPGTLLHGIAVRNGSITNFDIGVDLRFAEGSIVEGLQVIGGGVGILVNSGIVKGSTATGLIGGMGGPGTVFTGNNSSFNQIYGFNINAGSTGIGNTATNNVNGILVDCPSNVTDNTAVNNSGGNLVLNGNGCNNTNNVAP
jgi:hypothetical protein